MKMGSIHGCPTESIQLHTKYDPRGYFREIYKSGSTLIPDHYVWQQMNLSVSKQAALRGIHIAPYAKLVYPVTGQIYQVVLDFRRWSPTYGCGLGRILRPDRLGFVPEHCGHAFYAMVDSTVVYLQSGVYQPEAEQGIHPVDPDLAIDWPTRYPGEPMTISHKDATAPYVRDVFPEFLEAMKR